MKWISTPWFACLWFLLALLSYFYLDPHVPFWVTQNLSPKEIHWAELITLPGNAIYPIIIFLFGFVFFKWVLKKPQASLNCLYLLISILMSGIICDVFKGLLGRARPELLISHLHLYGFYFWKFHAAYWSFPSGHSTVLGAYSIGLGLLFPRFFWMFLILGFLCASARVLALDHYPSDVLMGFYLGALTAWLIYRKFLQKKIIKK